MKGTITQQVYFYFRDPAGTNHQTLVTFNGSWQQVSILNQTVAGTGNSGQCLIGVSNTDWVGATQKPAVTFSVFQFQLNAGATLNAAF